MRFNKLARRQFLVEGRWIISHGISEGVNLLVKQDPQLLNKDFFHVASLNLIMPKRRFPDIHHNDSYAHRPYMSSCTRHKRRKAVTTSESPTAEKTATGGYGATATPLQRLDRRRPITCRPTLMAWASKRLPSLQSRFSALYRTPRVLLFSTNVFCIVVPVMLAKFEEQLSQRNSTAIQMPTAINTILGAENRRVQHKISISIFFESQVGKSFVILFI